MDAVFAIPAELAGADVASGVAHLTVREELYPLDAVFAAAFTFIKDCWVVIDRADAEHWRVVLTPKAAGATAAVLEAWVGGFANELLACAYRHRLAKANRATVEAVTAAALAGALGPPTLDELEDFDFSNEAFEDPLGIAQSWEAKYGKKAKASDPPPAGATDDDGGAARAADAAGATSDDGAPDGDGGAA
jgi:His-Xaa-Ser system protein HxsD